MFLRQRPTLIAALVFATVLALAGISRLGFDDSPRNTFRRNDRANAVLEQFYADFGAEDNDVLIMIEAPDVFDPAVQTIAREIVAEAQEVSGVAYVHSIFDIRRAGSAVVPLMPFADAPPERVEQARQWAREHPLVAGQLISADNKTMLVFARLAGEDLSSSQVFRLVTSLRRILESATEPPVRLLLAGHPVIRADLFVALRTEQFKFLALSGIVTTVISWLLFRRLVAAAIALSAPLVGVIWTVGILGWAGLPINGFNTVIPSLVFVIGFAEAVHLMFHFCGLRRRGVPSPIAAGDVVKRLAPATGLTTVTTAIGFGSLGLAANPVIRNFGFACAAGAVCMFFSVMTVLPLLASTRLGDHVVRRGSHRHRVRR